MTGEGWEMRMERGWKGRWGPNGEGPCTNRIYPRKTGNTQHKKHHQCNISHQIE